MDPFIHRGRVQAQGGGVEESVPWAQDQPPTAREGHEMLNALEVRLTARESACRAEAFRQAHEYIDRAARVGGSHAPDRKSYPAPPRKDQRRVDIEVLKGIAFVPDES